MSLFYARTLKCLFLLLLVNMGFSTQVKALVAGDIAFTGYISSNTTDEFSFILLAPVTNGTVIRFTDNGWTGSAFRTGEGVITWTSNADYPVGTEIRIVGTSATYAGTGGSAGTINVISGSFSLSTSGDQILAYQGSEVSPVFISAIHMNYWTTAAGDPANTTAANWDGTSSSSVSSAVPTGLTGGTSAIWIYSASAQHPTEKTNARFNCTGSLNTAANIRASVYTFSNWIGDANITPASFTLPTNCNYAGVFLPIELVSFQARNMVSSVAVAWTVTDLSNFSHFELERSNGDNNFVTITRINGDNSGHYSYNDLEALRSSASLFYYRLKMVDRDGDFSYSNIVSVKNKKGSTYIVDNLVNPVKDKISFNLSTQNSGPVTLELTDLSGRRIAAKTYQVAAGTTSMQIADDKVLARGMYLLKITADGSSNIYKLVKE